MGHVFVDFDWEDVCQGFCRTAGCSRDRLREVFSHVAQLGYERGTVSTQDFLVEINRRLNSTISREVFNDLWTFGFRENEEMARLLQTLRSQRPLYLLSNTNEVHYDFVQSRFNVSRHFDEMILSYKVGYTKPQAEIYREVLRRSKVDAEHCLFVDDLECNVNAARKLGMNTIQFRGVEALKQNLQGFGFTVD
jgi:putative hydrolase of the HAD superfamily